MHHYQYVCCIILLSFYNVTATHFVNEFKEEPTIYTNRWVIETKYPQNIANKYGFQVLGQVIEDTNIYEMESIGYPKVSQTLTNQIKFKMESLKHDPDVFQATLQIGNKRERKSHRLEFTDPMWNETWHLNPNTMPSDPTGSKNGAMDVMSAWIQGFTGNNVRVAHIDDGIDYTHPDLRYNYDPTISTDIGDNDDDPFPSDKDDNHGTSMAGIVAAAANNSLCSVGIAYESRMGMIRLNLDEVLTDATEARAFSYSRSRVDVYINGWGPAKGRLDVVGSLAKQALKEGTQQGRNGKGNIFVFPAGNEGAYHGCDYNGYVNSMYTIGVNGAGQTGSKPYYGVSCTAVLTTTFTSGNYPEKYMVTTDVGEKCTNKFSGTSSSVSVAGGILALTLQANPNLTWRDMQHLIVLSSKTAPLKADDAKWIVNGANKRFSTTFGFGLLNAGMLVKNAREWKGVGEQLLCTALSADNKLIDRGHIKEFHFKFDSNTCKVRFVEHVVLTVNAKARKRGDIDIQLRSPMGTNLKLFSGYKGDYSFEGFSNVDFLSVGTWGENPIGGKWILSFVNKGSIKNPNKTLSISNWRVDVHGTSQKPTF